MPTRTFRALVITLLSIAASGCNLGELFPDDDPHAFFDAGDVPMGEAGASGGPAFEADSGVMVDADASAPEMDAGSFEDGAAPESDAGEKDDAGNMDDGVCGPKDEDGSADCDGVCGELDSPDGRDCDGVCDPSDHGSGADCDTICDASEDAESPDCNGSCSSVDALESVDCDGVCDTSDATAGVDCDGICLTTDAVDGADCDGICGAADAAQTGDCDGACATSDLAGSADCDGYCGADDASDGADCDGVCDAGESGSDCNGACDENDAADTSDCNGVCEATDAAGSVDCDGLCAAVDSEVGSSDCDEHCDAGEEGSMDCPVHCEVSAFSDFGDCSAACGGGTQTRTRTVVTAAALGGDECPALTEQQACNAAPCPVDCQVSAFSDFSACSASCGDGIQTRSRSVTVEPAHGGQECPVLVEDQACNDGPCPVDCQVSEWSDFSTCSASCDGGTQTRTRSVTVEPAHGGQECPVLVEDQACNEGPCPVDCQVSEWSDFSACSASCDGGTQTRTRSVIVEAAHGGASCPELSDVQTCNNQACDPCAIDPGLCDPCLTNPTLCDPCFIIPGSCDPCFINPWLCNPCLIDPWICDPCYANPLDCQSCDSPDGRC